MASGRPDFHPSMFIYRKKKKKSFPLSQLSQPQFVLVCECPPFKQPRGWGAAVGWARLSCPPSRQDKDFSQTLWNHRVGNSPRKIRMLLPKEGEGIQSGHARLTLSSSLTNIRGTWDWQEVTWSVVWQSINQTRTSVSYLVSSVFVF